jgi:hypothetical protein
MGESAPWSELQRRHRTVAGNTVRAGVLGANDGLVSNLSLVAGVAGAALSGRIVFITGLAGLFAGAGAMASGEWISVQTVREMHSRELALEAEELKRFPLEETDELAGLYERHGLPKDGARNLAENVMKTPETALGVMAREELVSTQTSYRPSRRQVRPPCCSALGRSCPFCRLRSPAAPRRYGPAWSPARWRCSCLGLSCHQPVAASLGSSSGLLRPRRCRDHLHNRADRRARCRIAPGRAGREANGR